MNLKEAIARVRELDRAATAGKWSVEDYREDGDWRSTGLIWARTEEQHYSPGTRVAATNCDDLSAVSAPEKIEEFEANAQFIAEARTLLPLLAAACEEMAGGLEYYANAKSAVWDLGNDPPKLVPTLGFGPYRARAALQRAEELLAGERGKG